MARPDADDSYGFYLPAVVEVDVGVSGGLVSQRYHRVSRGFNQPLVTASRRLQAFIKESETRCTQCQGERRNDEAGRGRRRSRKCRDQETKIAGSPMPASRTGRQGRSSWVRLGVIWCHIQAVCRGAVVARDIAAIPLPAQPSQRRRARNAIVKREDNWQGHDQHKSQDARSTEKRHCNVISVCICTCVCDCECECACGRTRACAGEGP